LSDVLKLDIVKKAFTLIEVLITLAIITMVTVLGVPAFSKYGENARFDQKVSEIKYGLEETHLKMLNPENGVKEYIFESNFTTQTILFKKKNADDTVSEYKRILISSKDRITGGTMTCKVETKNCGEGADPAQLFQLKSQSLNKSVSFELQHDPFGVNVSSGIYSE